MNFFMGFLTSSILSAIFFCIYIFLKEEVKKNKFNNIIPGQSYYVQSIGKVTVQKTDGIDVVYKDDSENTYSASCEIFLSFSKLTLKDTSPIQPPKKKPSIPVAQTYQYYNSKGSTFDIYVD